MLNPILNKENFEKSKNEIKELCDRFEISEEFYLRREYKEENVKVDFLVPMFKSLGWDMENRQGLASHFIEVIHEGFINVGDKIKSPDYTFRLYGEKLFFLEAKPPHKNLKQDKSSTYQIRRFGWTACLHLTILTNFKEFLVYETHTKPELTDSASISRIRYYKYTDYVDKWDEIYNIFSKEAIMKGSFDDFVISERIMEFQD